jgi:hypothetical protein
MVCKKCEKKLGTLITPDIWKDGSRNSKSGSAGRKINENKALKGKSKFVPYGKKCSYCSSLVHQTNATICQSCAYKKGLCSICGEKQVDLKMYNNSSV